MLDLHKTAVFTLVFVLVVFAASSLVAPASAAAAVPSLCKRADLLLELDSIRRPRGDVGEAQCHRLELSAVGLLQLDVATIGHDARLELHGAAWWQTIARNATEHLLLVEPGAYFVVVRAEDPRQPLPAYRLTASFVELTKSETDDELQIEPEKLGAAKSETDDELQIEPEKLGAPFACGGASKSETDDELQIEPEKLGAAKSETDDELQIEPEKVANGCQAIRPLLERLCRAADQLAADDHGDTLACATPLAGAVMAELDNGWGDDADVFRFTVEAWQTIELTTRGETDTRLALYGQDGRRLDSSLAESEPGGTRMVRTLGPGTYFVRIAGTGSAGAYQLRLDTID